jgi:hypothetical protein
VVDAVRRGSAGLGGLRLDLLDEEQVQTGLSAWRRRGEAGHATHNE